MKKVATILVGCFVILSIFGCTKKDPVPTESFEWPENQFTALIPEPKSKLGEITHDSSNSFSFESWKTTKKDFNNYVKKCKEKGFIVDYYGDGDTYRAENDTGYSLSIYYVSDKQKTDVMEVRIYTPNEETAQQTPTETQTQEQPVATTGIRPEFKEIMDSYESFINEYCEFMKKYSSSSDTASMMTDYADFMNRYADYTTKLSSFNEETMTTEEAAYYTEVNGRVIQKLSEVQ